MPPSDHLDVSASAVELRPLLAAAEGLLRAALRGDLTADAFLDEVLRHALRLVPCDVGSALLREGDRLRIRAADPAHRGDVGMIFPLADCISGLSVLRGEPIYIPDLAAMPAELTRAYKASRSAAIVMRSELATPLLAGAEALGALNLESRQPAAFTAEQIAAVRLLAAQAALALELMRSRQEAAALGAISLQLARATEMPEVVRTVLERALALIAGEFGQLLLLEGADLVVHYTTNQPARDVGLRFAVSQCVSGLAVEERRPIIVPDVTAAGYLVVEPPVEGGAARLRPRSTGRPRYQRVLEREKAVMQAELAVPLWRGDQVAGVLNVETARPEGFSPAQRADLIAFGQAAGARFGAALACTDERRSAGLAALLAEALAQAETAFGQLLEIAGDELVIVQTTGSEPLGTRVPAADSVSGQAALLKAEYYAPDVAEESRYRRYLGEEMKSELVVPLISRAAQAAGAEQVLGVLNLESPAPGVFTAEHARVLTALAGQAAVAIERARRTEVERLAAIGGLAGDIIHRLNNPIGALSGWLDTLQRKPFYAEMAAAYPYVTQFVARAARDIGRAKAIIQELRSEVRRQAPAAVMLQPLITAALERCGLTASPAPIRIALALPAEPLRVLAGPGLAGVFWNLFDNARKAMPAGGTLSVRAEHASAGWITVEVADTGVGIEPWRLATLFEAGGSTTADAYAPAHGLGLWWTRGQVESYGGKIEVVSEPDAGARFTLRLRAAT